MVVGGGGSDDGDEALEDDDVEVDDVVVDDAADDADDEDGAVVMKVWRLLLEEGVGVAPLTMVVGVDTDTKPSLLIGWMDKVGERVGERADREGGLRMWVDRVC